MNFTSRTYRVAIRRAMRIERKLRSVQLTSSHYPMQTWLPSWIAYKNQVRRTTRLQERKRKERK